MSKPLFQRNETGFSIVEVAVIAGILATIGTISYMQFSARSRQSEAKANLSALFSHERVFYGEWSAYFANFRNITYQPVGRIHYCHGFTSAGATCPGTYIGAGVTAGGAAVNFNTSVAAVCAGQCEEIVLPHDPGALSGAAVLAATSFTAEARGDIDGDATIDVWTIDSRKTFANTADDILN